MNTFIEWLTQNKEWIFSGIGIACINTLIYIFFNKNKKTKKESDKKIRVIGKGINKIVKIKPGENMGRAIENAINS